MMLQLAGNNGLYGSFPVGAQRGASISRARAPPLSRPDSDVTLEEGAAVFTGEVFTWSDRITAAGP